MSRAACCRLAPEQEELTDSTLLFRKSENQKVNTPTQTHTQHGLFYCLLLLLFHALYDDYDEQQEACYRSTGFGRETKSRPSSCLFVRTSLSLLPAVDFVLFTATLAIFPSVLIQLLIHQETSNSSPRPHLPAALAFTSSEAEAGTSLTPTHFAHTFMYY